LDTLSDAGIEVSVGTSLSSSSRNPHTDPVQLVEHSRVPRAAEGVKLARPISLDVTDESALYAEVEKHDLVISLTRECHLYHHSCTPRL
jgi:saccharopine dehydrogenase (NADP+, L-glutamate forming)